MSEKAFEKHEDALHPLGLVDEKDKPTWFTGGKPDLLKMLGIAGANAANIPLTERAALERQLFGAQGGGGFALLADPAVREQVTALNKEMNSPEFKNRYGGFVQAYTDNSTVQQARTAMQEFNIVMMELGKNILPSVNVALKDFKVGLEAIRGMLPGGPAGKATIGARVLEGAVAGGTWGAFGGPGGAVGGTIGGGIIGGALGLGEQTGGFGIDKGGTYSSPGKTGQPAHPKDQQPVVVKPAPITLNLNVDGRTLAQALSDANNAYLGFPTQAPAADGMAQPYGGDHNFPSN